MRPTPVQYAKAFSLLSSEGKSENLVSNLIAFLTRRGETKKLPSIVKELERLEREKNLETTVAIVTATEATPEMKTLLSKKAEQLFPGRKLTLSFSVDASVLGGARFRTDSAVCDATLKTELSALKKNFT